MRQPLLLATSAARCLQLSAACAAPSLTVIAKCAAKLSRELFRLRERQRHPLGTGLQQTLLVVVLNMRGRQHSNDRHAGGPGGFDARGAVLNNKAVRRSDPHMCC